MRKIRRRMGRMKRSNLGIRNKALGGKRKKKYRMKRRTRQKRR